MDKEKVIGLSNRINDVVTSERPTSISWHKIAYASELLQKELNSKPIMPKVFDDWYQSDFVSDESSLLAIESLNQEMRLYTLGYATLLGTWINNDYDNRYFMCIDAIINGYEVEK